MFNAHLLFIPYKALFLISRYIIAVLLWLNKWVSDYLIKIQFYLILALILLSNFVIKQITQTFYWVSIFKIIFWNPWILRYICRWMYFVLLRFLWFKWIYIFMKVLWWVEWAALNSYVCGRWFRTARTLVSWFLYFKFFRKNSFIIVNFISEFLRMPMVLNFNSASHSLFDVSFSDSILFALLCLSKQIHLFLSLAQHNLISMANNHRGQYWPSLIRRFFCCHIMFKSVASNLDWQSKYWHFVLMLF